MSTATTLRLLASGCSTSDLDGRHRQAELAIRDELTAARRAYPRTWLSLEEGTAILSEEVDELWDEVRFNHIGLARAEAVQVGAMAVRFISDLYEVGHDVDRDLAASAEVAPMVPNVGPRGRALASSHEGYGFLKREHDALWTAVRFGDPARPAGARVAAMAVRFISEITGGLS